MKNLSKKYEYVKDVEFDDIIDYIVKITGILTLMKFNL